MRTVAHAHPRTRGGTLFGTGVLGRAMAVGHQSGKGLNAASFRSLRRQAKGNSKRYRRAGENDCQSESSYQNRACAVAHKL
jgi:hypothetical protein